MSQPPRKVTMEMHNDHFQNRKRYNIPKAQLVLTDIPYNLGNAAYASNPKWYKDGDNANGESKLAGKQFFDTDKNFNLNEFFHFCNKLVKPEPKEAGTAGAMIVFCAFGQMPQLIEVAAKYGFKRYINLNFYKNYSPQVLKANMRIVGNTEYALLSLPRQIAQIQQQRQDGIQLHAHAARHRHPKDPPDTEARGTPE